MVNFRNRRRGVAEIIGGLFILALLITVMGLSVVVFGAFQSYQSALDGRTAYQNVKQSEQMGPITVTFASGSQLMVSASNDGSTPLHLVSLWVTGASGVAHFDQTLSGSQSFNVWIAPGKSSTFSANYTWVAGPLTVELVSERGSMFYKAVTAP